MFGRTRWERLRRVLTIVQKIHVTKPLFWCRESLTQIAELDAAIDRLLASPENEDEKRAKRLALVLHTALAKITAEYSSGRIITDQDEEADLLRQTLYELGSLLARDLKHDPEQNAPFEQYTLDDVQRTIDSWMLAAGVATPHDLLTRLRTADRFPLAKHRSNLIETYLEFRSSKIPADALLNAFFDVRKADGDAFERLQRIYDRFLKEPYSYNRTLLALVGKLPAGHLDLTLQTFCNMLTDQGAGNCYAQAYALYQTLIFYGFDAHLIVGKPVQKEDRLAYYGHAAVLVNTGIVDAEKGERLLYLDPGMSIEGPILFWKGEDSLEPPFRHRRWKLQRIDETTVQLAVWSSAGWNDLHGEYTMRIVPMTAVEFKQEWLRLRAHKLENIDEIKIKFNKLAIIDGIPVVLMVMWDAKRSQYMLRVRAKEGMIDELAMPLDFSIGYLLFNPGAQREINLLREFDIDPASFTELLQLLEEYRRSLEQGTQTLLAA